MTKEEIMFLSDKLAYTLHGTKLLTEVTDALNELFLYKVIDDSFVKQDLQRLDKYEQILGSGRLTDRNYKNTTLDIDSCKPYIKLGQLEDIYEEGKKNE